MRQIKKLTWLQVCFLGDMRVIWCNSLGDSLFQVYVMNFVKIVLDFYLHITSHVSQTFASCIHYTSYSLLNFVHVIVCDFVLAIQDWNFLEFNAKCAWSLRPLGKLIENLIFGRSGFNTTVFEKYFISYSCILFITYYVLRSFCIKLLCFSKICFFQEFRSIEPVSWLIEIVIKKIVLNLPGSIGSGSIECNFRLIESIFRSIKNHSERFFIFLFFLFL